MNNFLYRRCKYLLVFLLMVGFANGATRMELYKQIRDMYDQAEYLAWRKLLLQFSKEQNELYRKLEKNSFFNKAYKEKIEKDVYLGLNFGKFEFLVDDYSIILQIIALTNQFGDDPWKGELLYKRINQLAENIQEDDLRFHIKNLIDLNYKTANIYHIEKSFFKRFTEENLKNNALQYIKPAVKSFADLAKEDDFIDFASPIFAEQIVSEKLKKIITTYEKNQPEIQKKYQTIYKTYNPKTKIAYPQNLPTLDEIILDLKKRLEKEKEERLEKEKLQFEEKKAVKDDVSLDEKSVKKQKKLKEAQHKAKKKKKVQIQKKKSEEAMSFKEKKAREVALKKESKEEEREEKKISLQKKEFDEVQYYNKKYKTDETDKSKVIAITDRVIKIDDPRNNALITLIKVKDADRKKPERLQRAKRVQLWFDNSIQALINRGELKESMKRKDLPWELEYNIRRHAFADMVDAFVLRYGIDSEYIDEKNKKILNKVIPGEIEFFDQFDQKTNKLLKITGLFAYGFSEKTKECYHRFFTRKPFNDQLEEFMRTGKWVIKDEERKDKE